MTVKSWVIIHEMILSSNYSNSRTTADSGSNLQCCLCPHLVPNQSRSKDIMQLLWWREWWGWEWLKRPRERQRLVFPAHVGISFWNPFPWQPGFGWLEHIEFCSWILNNTDTVLVSLVAVIEGVLLGTLSENGSTRNEKESTTLPSRPIWTHPRVGSVVPVVILHSQSVL